MYCQRAGERLPLTLTAFFAALLLAGGVSGRSISPSKAGAASTSTARVPAVLTGQTHAPRWLESLPSPSRNAFNLCPPGEYTNTSAPAGAGVQCVACKAGHYCEGESFDAGSGIEIDMFSIAGLSESNKWDGGVLAPNGKIFGIPMSAKNVLIIDPATNTKDTTKITGLSSDLYKWGGGVLAPNGKIYGVPLRAEQVLIIDPVADTSDTTSITGLSGVDKWKGGVLARNGKIYCIPCDATRVLIINPADDTVDLTSITGLDSDYYKWYGGVLAPNGKIFAMPFNAESVLIIDPATNTKDETSITGLSGSQKWYGGVLAHNGKIYGIPYDAESVLIIDPATYATDTTSIVVSGPGSKKWCGGVLAPNGMIFGTPYMASFLLIINPATNTTAQIIPAGVGNSGLSGDYKWTGGVLAQNGKIFWIPMSAENVPIITPQTITTGAVPCPAGRYGTKLGQSSVSDCKECKEGKFGINASGQTTEAVACPHLCPIGRYGTVGGQWTEALGCSSLCPATTYGIREGGSTIEEACKYCPKGRSSGAGFPDCFFLCGLGEYMNPDRSAASTCIDCAAGRYNDINGATNASFCKVCSRGFYCLGKPLPRPCPAGTYGADTEYTNYTSCTPCPAATFSSATGLDAEAKCNQCPPGSASKVLGAKTADECLPKCGKGTFSDQPGSTECRTCTSGESEKDAGSTYCKDCPPGKHFVPSNAQGLPECRDCEAGKYADDAGLAECKGCTTGTTSEAGAKFCGSCPAGKVLDPVANKCKNCDAGWISATGDPECQPCGNGTYADPSHVECRACEAGRYGESRALATPACSGECPVGKHSYRYATKCLPCEKGKYQNASGMEACVLCPDRRTSEAEASRCGCEAGRYENDLEECVPCVEGLACDIAGLNLTTLALVEGFWRPHAASDEVLACPAPKACLASNCSVGNEGVLCAVCGDGHYRVSPSLPCEECGSSGLAVLSALASLAGMGLAITAFIYVNRRAPNGMLRPFINLVQQLTVMLMFDAPFPQALTDLARVLMGVSLGVEVVSPQCAGVRPSYYGKFGFVVFTLLSLCLGLMLGPLVKTLREKRPIREMVKSPSSAVAMRDLFVVVLLLHPTVSGMAMVFFRCRTIDGETYLMADYSLTCYDGTWLAFLPLVLVVLLAYSIGTPVGIYLLLKARQAGLYNEHGKVISQPLDILYAVYRAETYYFETIQMLFKLGLWSALVFFEHGTEMQLALALIVNVLQLSVHLKLEPMGGKDAALLNNLQTGTLVLTVYINFGALSMNYLEVSKRLATYTNPDQEGSFDAQIYVIQILMELLTFGLLLTFGGVGIKKAVEKAKDGVSSGGGLAAHNVLTKITSSVEGIGRLASFRGFSTSSSPPPQQRDQELVVRHPTGMADDALPTVVNPPMRKGELPKGWMETESKDGVKYYHNTDTGQTSWT